MFCDSHAHLSFLPGKGIALDRFFSDWESLGGGSILDPGVKAGDLAERLALSAHKSYVRFASGIWPGGEAVKDVAGHVERLATDAARPETIAIGECGLDYHWNEGGAAVQRALFEAQLDLAERLGKPVIVHSRDADADTGAILREHPGVRGVIHCCPFGPDEALSLVELGFFISFAGNVTYKNAGILRETLKAVPVFRILAETDAPYLAPEGMRGKSNSPLSIPRIVKFMAGEREMDERILETAIETNFRSLFGA